MLGDYAIERRLTGRLTQAMLDPCDIGYPHLSKHTPLRSDCRIKDTQERALSRGE